MCERREGDRGFSERRRIGKKTRKKRRDGVFNRWNKHPEQKKQRQFRPLEDSEKLAVLYLDRRYVTANG